MLLNFILLILYISIRSDPNPQFKFSPHDPENTHLNPFRKRFFFVEIIRNQFRRCNHQVVAWPSARYCVPCKVNNNNNNGENITPSEKKTHKPNGKLPSFMAISYANEPFLTQNSHFWALRIFFAEPSFMPSLININVDRIQFLAKYCL